MHFIISFPADEDKEPLLNLSYKQKEPDQTSPTSPTLFGFDKPKDQPLETTLTKPSKTDDTAPKKASKGEMSYFSTYPVPSTTATTSNVVPYIFKHEN